MPRHVLPVCLLRTTQSPWPKFAPRHDSSRTRVAMKVAGPCADAASASRLFRSNRFHCCRSRRHRPNEEGPLASGPATHPTGPSASGPWRLAPVPVAKPDKSSSNACPRDRRRLPWPQWRLQRSCACNGVA